MKNRIIRLFVGFAGLLTFVGGARAQTVQFWFNRMGDPATSQPSIINVTSGSTPAFSVYVETQNVGALSGLNVLFGYSTTNSTGAGATPSNTNATFNSFAWAQSDLASDQAFAGQGGGGIVGGGAATRPYGLFASSLNLGGTFAGTGDGVPFHLMDVTLNINAAPGTDIPVTIWSSATSSTSGVDNYASAVVNGASNEFFPTSPYTATLHVVPVPEPASLAILGLGAAALIRKRRRN